MKRVNKTRHGVFWGAMAGWTGFMIFITAMVRMDSTTATMSYITAFAWWLTVIVIFGLGFIAYVLTDPEA